MRNKIEVILGARQGVNWKTLQVGTIADYQGEICIISKERLIRFSDGDYWLNDFKVNVIPSGSTIHVTVL